jgi:hypothetical protein
MSLLLVVLPFPILYLEYVTLAIWWTGEAADLYKLMGAIPLYWDLFLIFHA